MTTRLLLALTLLSLAGRAEALTVAVLTPTSVSLAWDAQVDATQYVVQQSVTSGANYANVVWTSGTAETVTGLTPGVTYYWIVRAVNAAGLWSGPSNEVSLTMPTGPSPDECAFPTGLYAVLVTPTSVLVAGSKGPGAPARFDFRVASPNSPVNRVVVMIDGAIVQPPMGCPTEGVDCGAVMTPLAGYNFLLPASGRHTLTVTAWNRKGCADTRSYGPGLVVP